MTATPHISQVHHKTLSRKHSMDIALALKNIIKRSLNRRDGQSARNDHRKEMEVSFQHSKCWSTWKKKKNSILLQHTGSRLLLCLGSTDHTGNQDHLKQRDHMKRNQTMQDNQKKTSSTNVQYMSFGATTKIAQYGVNLSLFIFLIGTTRIFFSL